MSIRMVVLATPLFALAPAAVAGQQDCTSSLAAIVPAGDSPDPTKYAEGKLTRQQARSATLFLRDGTPVRPSRSVECMQKAPLGDTCWKCAKATDGSVHCWEIECPDVIKSPDGGESEARQPALPRVNAKLASPDRGAAAADLLPVTGLRVGLKLIPWGQTMAISADEASSTQRGTCSFRYRFDTKNAGQAGAAAAQNRVLLEALTGTALADVPLPALAAGAQHASSGLLQLKPGTWTLYVSVDADQIVGESDEQNNLRRVRVQVEGSCT